MNLTINEHFSLESCQNEKEWNQVCGLIRFVRDGNLPPDWMVMVIASGLTDRVAKRWGKPDLFHKRQPSQSFYDYVFGQLPV